MKKDAKTNPLAHTHTYTHTKKRILYTDQGAQLFGHLKTIEINLAGNIAGRVNRRPARSRQFRLYIFSRFIFFILPPRFILFRVDEFVGRLFESVFRSPLGASALIRPMGNAREKSFRRRFRNDRASVKPFAVRENK